MSLSLEEPVKTLIRLLRNQMRVIKPNGELAKIHVSEEWYNAEISRQFDGQITVGLQECRERKLSVDGKSRLSIVDFRINVWVLDLPQKSSETREMRNKIVNEVKRILGEKNVSPNVFLYDFVGVGRETGEHKAFLAVSDVELSLDSQAWAELTSEDYVKVWYSDDERLTLSTQETANYPFMLFKFKLDAEKECLKSLKLNFEGYGESPAGYGVTAKIWNFSGGGWSNPNMGYGGSDETVSITVSSNFEEYIGDNGYVYMLVETTNPSDGDASAVLNCDYVWMEFAVNGLSHCDLVSYRNLDKVDVRPFIWRTELTARGWIFERLA